MICEKLLEGLDDIEVVQQEHHLRRDGKHR